MVDGLSLEDLEALSDSGNDLLREAQEFSTQRSNLRQAETSATQEKLKLTKNRMVQVQDTNAAAIDIITDMEDDHARIDEINNNLLLRIIEPFAGTVNPNYSRRRLVGNLKTDQTRLNILQAKDTLKQSSYQQTVNALDASVAVEAARAGEEQADVQEIAATLEIQLSNRERQSALRSEILRLSEDEDALDELASTGKISKRLIEIEKRTRSNEKFKDEQETFERVRMEEALKQNKLQTANAKELDSGEFAKDNPDIAMQQIKEEKTRRANLELSLSQLRSAVRRQAVTEKLGRMTLEDLKKLAAAPQRIPFVEDELIARTEKESASKSRKMQMEREVETNIRIARGNVLRETPTSQKQEWLKRAVANEGLVEIEDGITFTAKELQASLQESVLVESEELTRMAGQSTLESAISRNLDSTMRALNLPTETGASTRDKLSAIVNSQNSSEDEKIAAEALQGMIDSTLVRALGTTEAIGNQKLKVAAAADDLKKATHARAIASQPKVLQKPMQDFLKNGNISNNADAIIVTTNTAIFGELDATISPAYGKASKILLQAGKDMGLASKGATDAENATQLAMLLGDSDPADFVMQASVRKEVQEAMADPITGTALIQTHIAAANALGLIDLAEQLRSNKSFQNKQGQFDEKLYLTALRKAADESEEFNYEGYITTYKTSMDAVIRQVTSTRNTGGLQIAAMNKLLFNNNQVPIIKNRLDVRLLGSQGGQGESILDIVGRVGKPIIGNIPQVRAAKVVQDRLDSGKPITPVGFLIDELTKKRFGTAEGAE